MDTALFRQRPVGILVLLAVTTLVALGGGWSLMFYAAWAIAFLLVIAYVSALDLLFGWSLLKIFG